MIIVFFRNNPVWRAWHGGWYLRVNRPASDRPVAKCKCDNLHPRQSDRSKTLVSLLSSLPPNRPLRTLIYHQQVLFQVQSDFHNVHCEVSSLTPSLKSVYNAKSPSLGVKIINLSLNTTLL